MKIYNRNNQNGKNRKDCQNGLRVVIMMNEKSIIKNINKKVFDRKDILDAVRTEFPDFKESSMRNLLEKLLSDKLIIRIGRNRYVLNDNKTEYKGKISEDTKVLINNIKAQYPYISFQIWELNWLNEFLNHLLAHNMIFLDIENDGCEFVYSSLRNIYNAGLLLRPTEKELNYYTDDGVIIIDRLVSEAPKGYENGAPLEKIIVDLFANKTVASMVSMGDYPDMLERIFSRYVIDQSKLFRYASRRNKDRLIYDFIKNNTDIDLIVEV